MCKTIRKNFDQVEFLCKLLFRCPTSTRILNFNHGFQFFIELKEANFKFLANISKILYFILLKK